MKNVIYKVNLNNRDKFMQFHKDIVTEHDELDDTLIKLTHLRTNNTDSNIRYTLEHIK